MEDEAGLIQQRRSKLAPPLSRSLDLQGSKTQSPRVRALFNDGTESSQWQIPPKSRVRKAEEDASCFVDGADTESKSLGSNKREPLEKENIANNQQRRCNSGLSSEVRSGSLELERAQTISKSLVNRSLPESFEKQSDDVSLFSRSSTDERTKVEGEKLRTLSGVWGSIQRESENRSASAADLDRLDRCTTDPTYPEESASDILPPSSQPLPCGECAHTRSAELSCLFPNELGLESHGSDMPETRISYLETLRCVGLDSHALREKGLFMRSKSAPDAPSPLGGFTINRVTKTPTVMRVRRGSSYKIRRVRDSSSPVPQERVEEEAEEDQVHVDADPMIVATPSEPKSPTLITRLAHHPQAAPGSIGLNMNAMSLDTPAGGYGKPPRLRVECLQSQDHDGGCKTPLLVGCQTPELACTGSPEKVGGKSSLSSGTTAGFGILRQISGISKQVHLVRHGESEYNRLLNCNKSWEDPQIFDPPLTRKGVEQCAVLKERLMRMEGLETALWVCSPLSRAIDTMLHSCPLDIEQLVARGQLQIRGEVTEFLQTTGDIGLPASNLRRKYPMLAPAMENLPEVWWYGNLESNNPFKKHCKQFESKVSEQHRIERFRRVLERSNNQVVICFGHSLFWKHFTAAKESLKNCDMLTIQV